MNTSNILYTFTYSPLDLSLNNATKAWGPAKRFPASVKAELEDLISDFEDGGFEDIEGFQDKVCEIRLKQTDSAVKRLLNFVLSLVDGLTAKEKKVREMQLQTSFVHSLMKAMFKLNKDHDVYASNLVFDKDDELLKGCRPDYLVEVKGDVKNVVGEVKPLGSRKADVEWDMLRLGVFELWSCRYLGVFPDDSHQGQILYYDQIQECLPYATNRNNNPSPLLYRPEDIPITIELDL